MAKDEKVTPAVRHEFLHTPLVTYNEDDISSFPRLFCALNFLLDSLFCAILMLEYNHWQVLYGALALVDLKRLSHEIEVSSRWYEWIEKFEDTPLEVFELSVVFRIFLFFRGTSKRLSLPL